MKMLVPRSTHRRTLAAAMTDVTRLAEIHADTAVPSDVATWLARLALLNGVPFGYLVPHDTMLPPESIRFFTVDANWINALLDGACSIGRASSASATQDAVLTSKLFLAANPPAVVSGFLLRSAVVSGWPGLEVIAYDKDGKVIAPPPLRMERLAPTVLLFLARGMIERVDIHEPAEGLHFGTELDNKNNVYVRARYITVPTNVTKKAPGDAIDGDPGRVDVKFRDPTHDRRVVRIAHLADRLGTALKGSGANQDGGKERPFTSAEFAAEMVEGVQLVQFLNRGTA